MTTVAPLPIETIDLAPWCVVLATALVATVVNLTQRRLANPVVLCLWFCGLAYAAWMGKWNALELNLGMVVMAMPQVAIVVLTNRRAERRNERQTEFEANAPATTESAAGALHREHLPPHPMPQADEQPPLRNVA